MQDIEIKSSLAILRKRLWIIVLLFAVTMTVILAGALSAVPMYQSAVRLQILPVESEQVALYSRAANSGEDVVAVIAIQFEQILRSSKIAWRTINQLGLDIDADQLLENLNFSKEYSFSEYGFVTVTAGATSPQNAEAIVTTQVENALAEYRQDQSRPALVAGDFISEQLKDAEQALAAANSALLRFRLTNNLESLDRETTSYQDIVRDLRIRKQDAVLAETELEARIAGLEAEAAKAEAAAQQAKANSPEQAAALGRAGSLRSSAASLRADLDGQRALQAEYERAIVSWETELALLINLSAEEAQLGNAVRQAQDTRDFLFGKSLEAQLKQQQGLSIGYLKVVDAARRPTAPQPARTLQTAVIGGVLSLLLGAILAFLVESIDIQLRRAKARQAPPP